MPFPIYATLDDLANYLGVTDVETLPDESERLLKRASELVAYVSMDNLDITKQGHLDASRLATCAQIEYWLEVSEQSDISGQQPSGFSIGDISMNLDVSNNSYNMISRLAPRAKQYLNMWGLLYRGLR